VNRAIVIVQELGGTDHFVGVPEAIRSRGRDVRRM